MVLDSLTTVHGAGSLTLVPQTQAVGADVGMDRVCV